MSLLDDFIDRTVKLADTAGRLELAKNGVNTYTPTQTAMVETNGSGDPVVVQGRPAPVQATAKGSEALFGSLERIANDATGKAAAVAGAHEVRKMLPYVVGGMALAITIYLLTKK